MATISRSVRVHRNIDEVAAVATDPDVVLPIIGSFGRCKRVALNPDGSQEWDLYIAVRTIHVGGRVRVERSSSHVLAWRSQIGKRHTGQTEVTPAGDSAVVTMSITTKFAGMFAGWLTERLAGGILARNMEAGLQQLRHAIEYGG